MRRRCDFLRQFPENARSRPWNTATRFFFFPLSYRFHKAVAISSGSRRADRSRSENGRSMFNRPATPIFPIAVFSRNAKTVLLLHQKKVSPRRRHRCGRTCKSNFAKLFYFLVTRDRFIGNRYCVYGFFRIERGRSPMVMILFRTDVLSPAQDTARKRERRNVKSAHFRSDKARAGGILSARIAIYRRFL